MTVIGSAEFLLAKDQCKFIASGSTREQNSDDHSGAMACATIHRSFSRWVGDRLDLQINPSEAFGANESSFPGLCAVEWMHV